MHVLIGLLCSAASLVLMAAVAWMNYRFMSRLGVSAFDGQVLGIASVSVDIMLGLLGPLIMWGLANARRLYVWSAVGVVSCFAVLSFASALGFAAEGRDGATAKRETTRIAVNATQEKLDRLQERRKRLGTPRQPAIVEAELAGLRADRRWMATRECSVVRSEQARQWCATAHRLRAELASANAAEQLEADIAAATSDLLAQRQASGHGLIDAQVDMIVEGTGWPEGKVRVGLLLLIAFVMQLGAGFGVALGLAPLQSYLEERKSQRLAKPTPGGHMVWSSGPPRADEAGPEAKAVSREGGAERDASRNNGKRRRANRRVH
jgi:hypothetical protein